MKANTIIEAIHFNDLDQFKTLLPDASLKQRRTALIEAASRGKNPYISLLLPVKSNVKREALLEAVRMGHVSTVGLLLPQYMRDSEALCCAIRSNQKEVFDFLVPLSPLPSHHFMALRACLHENNQRFGLFEIVLDEASILYPQQLRNDFHYVVSEAVHRKDAKALDVLLSHDMFSKISKTDMHSAVKNNDRTCVHRLLPYADQDSCSVALVEATRNLNFEFVHTLLKHSDPRWNGSAALQAAYIGKNPAMIDCLYSLSDPHAALYELQKRVTDVHWRALEERIQQDLHQTLHNETAQEFNTSSHTQRKM